MSESKFTPGPWELGPVLRECDGHSSNYFTEQREVYPPSAGPGEEQHGGPIAVFSMGECGAANVALFMAAPDLLAAAKLALEELREHPITPVLATVENAILRLEIAIAKAEPK